MKRIKSKRINYPHLDLNNPFDPNNLSGVDLSWADLLIDNPGDLFILKNIEVFNSCVAANNLHVDY